MLACMTKAYNMSMAAPQYKVDRTSDTDKFYIIDHATKKVFCEIDPEVVIVQDDGKARVIRALSDAELVQLAIDGKI